MVLVPASDDKQYDDYSKSKADWVAKNQPELVALEKAKKAEQEKKDGAGSKK